MFKLLCILDIISVLFFLGHPVCQKMVLSGGPIGHQVEHHILCGSI